MPYWYHALSIYYKGGYPARVLRIFNQVAHSLYINPKPDTARSVFICGLGRSGTTWLAELLKVSGDYRYMYEPFNKEQVPECRHFSMFQYLRPEANNDRYLLSAKKIFSGSIRNGWIDQYNVRPLAQLRLIKDVRSMLMLGWIRRHFASMPIIWLMRHPCASAVSRIKLNWKPLQSKEFLKQEELMLDHLAPFESAIVRAQGDFERHIINLCAQTYVAFSHLARGDVHLIFYENLCADPRAELRKLYAYLNEPFDESVLQHLGRRSASSPRNGSHKPSSNRADAVANWREHVSEQQLTFAHDTLKLFGLDQIYGDRDIADSDHAETLWRLPARVPNAGPQGLEERTSRATQPSAIEQHREAPTPRSSQ